MSKDTVRDAECVEKRKSGETETVGGSGLPRGKSGCASWGSRPSHERVLTSGLTLREGGEVGPAPGSPAGPQPAHLGRVGRCCRLGEGGQGAGLQEEGGLGSAPGQREGRAPAEPDCR